jgi:CRP-like cAMP-binding protein
METDQPLARLLRRLERAQPLSTEERSIINSIPVKVRTIEANRDVVRQGDYPTQCCFVFSGQLIRNRITESSQRRILSFHVPGDLPDLHSLYLTRADHNITALGQAVVGFISHHSLRELLLRSPRLMEALWHETLVEASIFREWEINLSGRDATARVAHLLCEITTRLRAVDMAKNLTFALPWTQHDIGDACGLSNVHVNRVVQTLRANDVIDWRSKVMRIVQWEELSRIAGFSPEYLHLPGTIKRNVSGAQGNSDRIGV